LDKTQALQRFCKTIKRKARAVLPASHRIEAVKGYFLKNCFAKII
jgi:hypothetical protein